MDWKILSAVILGLLLFFLVNKCSQDDKPNYDQIQTNEQLTRSAAIEKQQSQEALKRREQVKADLAKLRGARPAEKVVKLETADFTMQLSTRGGALKSFTLKHPQYTEPPRDWNTGLRSEVDTKGYVPVDMVTTNSSRHELNDPLRFEIYEGIDTLPDELDYEIVEQTDTRVSLRYTQPNLPIAIYKKFEVDKLRPYQVWLTVRVLNTSTSPVKFRAGVTQTGYQHETETEGSMFGKQPNLMNGICRYGGTLYREPWKNILAPFSGIGDLDFAGVETNYFLSAMIPGDDTPVSCTVRAEPGQDAAAGAYGVVRADLRFGEVDLKPGQDKIFNVKNFLGPKRFSMLRAVGHHLEKSVDFGWFAPIAHVLLWILLKFQSWIANWGLAIILLTVLVKAVLTPLTHRSFVSGEKMRLLKPEIDKLNEKFANDNAAKQQAVMALYKQYKINPLGGCLPMLLQMPIWIALYQTLRTSPELYHSNFFGWIHDLSSPDPYFVTPLVMGVFMFWQQRLSPTTLDNAQAKMMLYVMPPMFTAMMLFLPSGLTIYILINSILSIAHQLVIHRMRQRDGGLTTLGGPRIATKKA